MKRFLGLAVSPSSWIFTLILNVFILPICLLHFIHDAQAQFSDQELNTVNPQIKLTDGIYASNSNADSNWVYFDKDATMLPKTVYGDHEISFWGTNLGYVREPWYKLLEDANIKTIRYDISWSGLEKNGPITNDELNTNSYLLQAKELSDKGFNLIYTLNDTPPYANGNKNKGYWNQAVAPHRVIEEWEPDGELIDFSSNYTVQLQHAPGKAEEKPLLYTSLNPFFLLDVDDTTLKAQTTEHEEFCQFEMDDERQEPRICSLKNQPVQVGSEEIWLDFNGDGIYDNSEKWFRVNNWLDLDNSDKLPEDRRNVPRIQQQAYLISRDGIIKLPSWILYLFGYGKEIKPSLSPTKKIKMKVRYHSYITPSDGKGGSKYIEGVDYIVDDLNGKITWIPGFRLNVPKSNESFDTQLDTTKWKWNSDLLPLSHGIKDGQLQVTFDNTSELGNFLYQEITNPEPETEANFATSMKLAAFEAANPNVRAEVGIVIYKDENNWFRYSFTTPTLESSLFARPYLTQKVDGVITHTGDGGPYGTWCKAPRWISIVKRGTTYRLFLTNGSEPFNRTDEAGCSNREMIIAPEVSGEQPGTKSPIAQEIGFLGDSKLRVGISVQRYLNQGTITTNIDDFIIKTPTAPQNNKLRVLYDVLDLEPWKAFLNKFVNAYGQYAKHWEIWNEPDQGWQWHAKQELMGMMVSSAAQIVHQNDPNAKIIGPGYANGRAAQNGYRVISNGLTEGQARSIRGISWHPYLFSTKSPDADGWYWNNLGTLEDIRKNTKLTSQEASFGEIASMGGAAINKDLYISHHSQVDYGTRLLISSRRMPGVLGIQWWPFYDMDPVSVREDNAYGSHEGLVYQETRDDPQYNIPKPMYYAYLNIATNKGVIMDLVKYDHLDNPYPSNKSHQISEIKIGALDRSKLKSVKVCASMTNTHPSAIPPQIAGKYYGDQWVKRDLKDPLNPSSFVDTRINAAPLMVSVDTSNPNLKKEKWYLRAINQNTFKLVGSLSGAQGTAYVDQDFRSLNNVLSFKIPSPPYNYKYLPNDWYYFETYVGDGYNEIASWTNTGEVGYGKINLTLNAPVEARYLSIQFEKSTTVPYAIDEIEVFNTDNQNIATNALYLADGYVESDAGLLSSSPTIDIQPEDLHVSYSPIENSAWATFSVHALQSGKLSNLSYQWQKNRNDLARENSSSFRLQVTQKDNGSRFRVLVSNENGTTFSREAVLTVSRLRITKQPEDVYIEPGQLATFHVEVATQANVLFTYQWKRNGVNIPSANSASYSFIPTEADDGAKFQVVVSNDATSIASNQAELKLQQEQSRGTAPEITIQPQNVYITPGFMAKFQVTASSSTKLSYQWKKNGVRIPGANSSSYSLIPVLSDNGAKFTVVVSNSSGEVTSDAGTLAIGLLPQITQHPKNLTVKAGAVAEFNVSATGTNPIVYQWKRGKYNITGANASTYRFTPRMSDNGTEFWVQAINAFGIASSISAKLTVYETHSPTSSLNITGRLLPDGIAKHDFHVEMLIGNNTFHSDIGCIADGVPCFEALPNRGWQLRNIPTPSNLVLLGKAAGVKTRRISLNLTQPVQWNIVFSFVRQGVQFPLVLKRGLNQISFPFFSDMSPESVLPDVSLSKNLSYFDSKNQRMVTYSKDYPELFGPLSTSLGYILNIDSDQEIQLQGFIADDRVPLTKEWNLIGAPRTQKVSTLRFIDNGEVITYEQAIEREVINSSFIGLDSSSSSTFDVCQDSCSTDELRQGNGYYIYSMVDSLTALFSD